MPRSVEKYVKYCEVAFWLIIALVITYCVGRERGRHIAFIETNRAYYEHRGAGDLLDKYAFPQPFLTKYVDKHGLVTREEIDSIMQGYVQTWSIRDADGSIADKYEFNTGLFGGGYWGRNIMCIHYFSAQRLDFVDDCHGSVMLRP